MASASRLLRLETGWQACTFVNNNKRRPTPPPQGATCIPPDLNNYRQTHTLGATAVAREAGFPVYFITRACSRFGEISGQQKVSIRKEFSWDAPVYN